MKISRRNEDNESQSQSHDEAVLEKLLESRILFLSGDMNEQKAQEVISKLITLDYQNPTKDILFYIDSYGGDVYSLIAIHDVMKYLLRCDVATICIGKAMSAAAILLLSGTKGKRFITPNSKVMIHEVSTSDEGKLSYMKDSIEEATKLQSTLETFVSEYTKMTKKQIQNAFKKDSYLEAPVVKKYGIADHIMTSPELLHSIVKG